MIRNQKGFTLVELIVTMGVFIFVIMITSDAFNVIITQSSRLMKSEESNIEGMIGLEQFSHDIQQGGFGLPYAFASAAPSYSEAAGVPAIKYNGTPDVESTSEVPRAFSSGNNLISISGGGTAGNIMDGSDYLAIRGTTVGRSTASQRWTYTRYSSSAPIINTWPSSVENIDAGARVIVLNRVFNNTSYTNQLVTNSTITPTSNIEYYSAKYESDGLENAGGSKPAAFQPTVPNQMYFIYGINNSSNIRMPFNRSDYFVSRPTASGSMPAACAPKTGILYKTTVKHDNGGLDYIPIVDCVADMQVVYGWDLKNAGSPGTDGLIDTYSRADGGAVSGEASIDQVRGCLGDAGKAPETGYPAAAECIRTSLKLIKVYLLVQNGGKDKNYTSPVSFKLFDDGLTTLGRTYDLDSDMRNYRWKVYRIVVKPKNLQSNQ